MKRRSGESEWSVCTRALDSQEQGNRGSSALEGHTELVLIDTEPGE